MRNIFSMRWVTRNPPAMLMVPMKIAIAPKITVGDIACPEICSMPPMIMMPLMALVTLIKGVCSDGDTFQITCQPTKQAKINTVKWDRKAVGAPTPMPIRARAAQATTIQEEGSENNGEPQPCPQRLNRASLARRCP